MKPVSRLWLPLVLVLALLGYAQEASAQIKLSNAAASAGANAIVDLIDSGPGAGGFVIYDACPANVDDAPTGTVLAELEFAATAFGNAVNGVATAASITADSSANATGTAACFRWLDGSDVAYVQGTVTATGGGGDLTLVTTSITATQPVTVTSATFTLPKAP